MTRPIAFAIGLSAPLLAVAILCSMAALHAPLRAVKLCCWPAGALVCIACYCWYLLLYEHALHQTLARRAAEDAILTGFGEILNERAPLIRTGGKSEIIRCVRQYWRIQQDAKLGKKAARRFRIERKHIEWALENLVLDGKIRHVAVVRREDFVERYKLSRDSVGSLTETVAVVDRLTKSNSTASRRVGGLSQ